MIYSIIYGIMAAFALQDRSAHNSKSLYYTFFALGLFVFVAFRFEVGCDWSNYLARYQYRYRDSSFDSIANVNEPLWSLANVTLRKIGLSYPWINVTSALIFFSGVHALARRQPDRLGFLTLLFPLLIIHIAMSGIRQAAAIGIICFAYNAFSDRKVVKFVLIIAAASAMHSSALVFLLLAPLVSGGYSIWRLGIAAILAIPGIALMLGTPAAELAMDRYVGSGLQAGGAIFRVLTLTLTGLLFLLLLDGTWKSKFRYDYKIAKIGSFIMIGLVALIPFSTVIADRIAYYFFPLQAMILSRIIYLPIGKLRYISALAGYGVLGAVLVFWVSLSDHYEACYLPYQTWLFGTPSEMRWRY